MRSLHGLIHGSANFFRKIVIATEFIPPSLRVRRGPEVKCSTRDLEVTGSFVVVSLDRTPKGRCLVVGKSRKEINDVGCRRNMTE